MDFMRCGFCAATATTARFTDLLSANADGVHRSCVCGADGVEAPTEMDIQEAVNELILDRLQLEVHVLSPFSKLREAVEAHGYDAVLLREPRLALWVRPSLTHLVSRCDSSSGDLPSPVLFDGDERDRVLMLRLPPHPGAQPLLVDVEPARVGTVRAFLRDARSVQPPSWAHLSDDAWATHLTLADAVAFAAWCGKRVPDEGEWQRLGAPDVVKHLDIIGEIWEWTTTPHPRGGQVVRGGRWRDRAGGTCAGGLSPLGLPANRSREDRAAVDLGVRLVRDP